MAAKVSQVITSYAERLGKNLKTNGATIEPGLLVKLDSSGSTVSLASAASVFGMAYGGRYSVYRPTTRVFADSEPLTVIWGTGEALLSADFFTGGSLPNSGDLLYAAANGLWDVSGSVKVGQAVQTVSRTEPVSGGTSQNLAHIRFNIQP